MYLDGNGLGGSRICEARMIDGHGPRCGLQTERFQLRLDRIPVSQSQWVDGEGAEHKLVKQGTIQIHGRSRPR